MINDKEEELEIVQNSLPSEYHNITFKMSDIKDDDLILKNIKKITKNLIEGGECREFERTIMEIAETVPDGNEKDIVWVNHFNVLDYKLY